MKLDRNFLSSPTGHLALVVVLLIAGVLAVRWQQQRRQTKPLPTAKGSAPITLPRIFTREGARIPPKPATTAMAPAPAAPSMEPAKPVEKPRVLSLTLFAAKREPAAASLPPFAPYGRLIPCETIVALESNRLETPVIGLVTQDVWHDGRLVIPAGAEVHGRAALDRTRERLAAQGAWRIVCRTPDADNGTEFVVDGLALDREFDAESRRWGERDGSAGLRGQIVKTDNDGELKLFAATFLATATAALQDTRATTGLLGEAALPAATVRNVTLAGTGAVLGEYARSMREAIARDGFYLRVPAGKPFYLYVTQTLDRSQVRRGATPATASTTPARP